MPRAYMNSLPDWSRGWDNSIMDPLTDSRIEIIHLPTGLGVGYFGDSPMEESRTVRVRRCRNGQNFCACCGGMIFEGGDNLREHVEVDFGYGSSTCLTIKRNRDAETERQIKRQREADFLNTLRSRPQNDLTDVPTLPQELHGMLIDTATHDMQHNNARSMQEALNELSTKSVEPPRPETDPAKKLRNLYHKRKKYGNRKQEIN